MLNKLLGKILIIFNAVLAGANIVTGGVLLGILEIVMSLLILETVIELSKNDK